MEYVPLAFSGSSDAWFEVGGALARLHGVHASRPFAVPVNAAIVDQLNRAEGTPYESEIRRLAGRLLAIGSSTGVIHGEANPSNVRRRRNGELVLLDWDQAGVGPTALDYGYPIITTLISEQLHVDEGGIRAFASGYTDAGCALDTRAAFNAALFHAVRYMWFANTEARWERIRLALANEDALVELLRVAGGV